MDFTDKQVEILKEISYEKFVIEVMSHWKTAFPSILLRGDERIFYRYIREGIVLANKYGYSQRGPVRLYLDLMIISGVNFEKDPLFQWMNTEKGLSTSQIESSVYLHSKLRDYIDAVYGKNNVFINESKVRFKELNSKNLPVGANGDKHEVHELLKCIHPQRYNFSGFDAIESLIYISSEYCDRYKLKNERHRSYVTLIMFLFGCSFETDLVRNALIVKPLMWYLESEDVHSHYEIVSHYASFRI